MEDIYSSSGELDAEVQEDETLVCTASRGHFKKAYYSGLEIGVQPAGCYRLKAHLIGLYWVWKLKGDIAEGYEVEDTSDAGKIGAGGSGGPCSSEEWN
jgi:hypothetical protein